MSRPRVLCVVGPTAVGKSEVADKVASLLAGEVVSIDSMQIYRGMDIGTAKTPKEQRLRPLHLVDITDIKTPYSVSMFQKAARDCIDGLLAQNETPVLCGGTGLYLDAVIDEMSFPHGEQTSPRREEYERQAQERGSDYLHALLKERDPQSASEIHPHNVRRVIRALEMADDGMSYAEHHRGLKTRKPHYDALIWALTLPREKLYRRIDSRVDAMVAQGLFAEVELLERQGLRESPTASQAIGYKEVLLAQDGKIPYEDVADLIKRNTRRYAKRQLSWIARDGRARSIDIDDESPDTIAAQIVEDWSNHS